MEDFQTDEEVKDIMLKAIKHPHDYVLKPQKEGGGNNFFDGDIPPKLQSMLDKPEEVDELLTYLIMERIEPPMVKFTSLRNGQLTIADGLGELGIFSCVFTQNTGEGKHETLHYVNMGTLVRTKASHNNEGGVNAGYAVIDSPCIVPDEKFVWEKVQPLALI